jgi:putative methionine-R-sulfoxide reductase with GAF domain
MDTDMTNQIKTIKRELTAFRDVHKALHEIGSDMPKAQKDSLICLQLNKIYGARVTTLFSMNPKTERFEFQAGAGKGTRNYSGGFLEAGRQFESSPETNLQPGTSEDIKIRTLSGVYDFRNKFVLTLPIVVGKKTYSIFVCEFESPTPSVTEAYTPEMIRILLNYLGPLQAFYVETQMLEEKTKSLELLYEIGCNLSSIRDEDKLLETILALIEKYLQVDRCSLMIVDEDRKHLSIKKAFGIGDVDIKKVKVPLGEGIAGYVATGTRPLLIKDIATEKHLISQVSQAENFRTNSLLSVPLVAHGEVIGVINVNNRKDGRPFTENDMELLSKISSEIAAVLQRSYMALQLKKARELDKSINRSVI